MGKALKKDSDHRPLRRPPHRRIKRPAAPPPPHSAGREIVTLLLVAAAIFFGLALGSHYQLAGEPDLKPFSFQNASSSKNLLGPVGYFLSGILELLLGWCSWVTVVCCLALAHSVWSAAASKGPDEDQSGYIKAAMRLGSIGLGSMTMLISGAGLCAIVFGSTGGGIVGGAVARRLIPFISPIGTSIVCGSIFLIALTLSTGFSTFRFVRATGKVGGRSKDLVLGAARYSGKAVGAAAKAGATRKSAAVTRIASEPRLAERRIAPVAHHPLDLDYARPPEDGYILGNGLDKKLAKKKRVTVSNGTGSLSAVSPAAETDDDFFAFDDGDDLPAADFPVTTSQPMIKKRAVEDLSAQRKKKELKRKADSAVDCIPSTDLLQAVDPAAIQSALISEDELLRNSRRLEQSLMDFKIGGKVVEVHPGPVITLYEFEPAAGVKVNRVVTLADDLALALKVSSVRVYAPVPGKGTVGIEVPNREREIVRLREIIEAKDFSAPSMALALAVGKDTFGEPFVTDLAAMPHLLIAGATGTGKSVCINSLLLSLLYRHPPEELRLIMIDPKMLELSVYEEIPHLKAPVVTNPKRARGVLWWAVEEMERRYRLMRDLGVRNVAGYNNLIQGGRINPADDGEVEEVIELEEKNVVAAPEGARLGRSESSSPGRGMVDRATRRKLIAEGEPLPRIVIVVDELADLMLTVGREIEELLTRLAQKARAAGLHLILATQRPSVNVITGLIKANFPARISFKVASKIDARTVLDTSGAEKLLGQGDMLFISPGAGRVKRLHGAFVSDEEVHQVVDWLRSQGAPDYDTEIEGMIEKIEESETGGPGINGEGEEYDQFYDQAVNLVVEKGQASTSFIQRVFRIGYNRAARILETMEREGIVGPADGAKPRQIMMSGRSGGSGGSGTGGGDRF